MLVSVSVDIILWHMVHIVHVVQVWIPEAVVVHWTSGVHLGHVATLLENVLNARSTLIHPRLALWTTFSEWRTRQGGGKLLLAHNRLLLAVLEAVSSSQEAAVVEHVLVLRVDGPLMTFAARLLREFHKTLIQRQVVSDRTLPALLVWMVGVVGEPLGDEVVDTV